MSEEEESIDIGFDDECYYTSWDLIRMWTRRALRMREQEERQIKNKF